MDFVENGTSVGPLVMFEKVLHISEDFIVFMAFS